MEKLTALREERGWTIYEAASRAKVSWQSIANLERSASQTGPGDPPKTTIATANALIELFHPDLKLCDFVTETELRTVPRNAAAVPRLLAKQQ
jgi:DNA-binding XRE family transcriptional regulator